MATVKQPKNERAPLCLCGCGTLVNWRPGKGWAKYIKGHHHRGKIYSEKVKANITLHGGDINNPPLCKCGCGEPVRWKDGYGWFDYKLGHATRKPKTEEHKKKISEAHKKHNRGKRRRDNELVPGPGVYATWEYREARKRLVDGKSCSICGSTENIHAHHEIPGNDESLVPLCARCHPTAHAGPDAKGANPPKRERAPLCACGCGKPVNWKRVRGWAKYRKGHGFAKVPAGTRLGEPPLCSCGCGEPVKFRYGKGWNKYKRGHSQRVEGHYTQKNK